MSKGGGKTSEDYTSVSFNATSAGPITTLAGLQQLLDQVGAGLLVPAEAAEKVLNLINSAAFQDLGFARVDHHREFRQGFPEVVFGLGKTPEQVASISAQIVSRGHTLLVTRASDEAFSAVQKAVPGAAYQKLARTITFQQQDVQAGRGTILVAAAGTSQAGSLLPRHPPRASSTAPVCDEPPATTRASAPRRTPLEEPRSGAATAPGLP